MFEWIIFRSLILSNVFFVVVLFFAGGYGKADKATQGSVERSSSGDVAGKETSDENDISEKVQPWIVGVLPVVIKPTSAAPIEAVFRKSVRDGLTRSGQQTVVNSRVEAARVRFPLIDSCEKGECVSEIASALKAEILVRLSVEVTGKNYSFELKAMDPDGKVSAKEAGRCDICTLTEAVKTSSELAARLGKDLEKKRAALPPPPVPLGGECGGRRVCMKGMICKKGKCMWAHEDPEAEPPKKKVITKPKDEDGEKKQKKPVPEVLIKKKAPKPVRHHPWGQFAIVTGGVGAVGLIVGTAMAAIDGKPSCTRPNGRESCSQRYDTKAAGALLLTTGILAGGASAVFGYLWWKGKKNKVKKVDVMVLPSKRGVTASAGFKF